MTIVVTSRREATGVRRFEILHGTFTDGDTYIGKFKTIDAVILNCRTIAGAYASVSGATITLNCSTASGAEFDLFIIGGN